MQKIEINNLQVLQFKNLSQYPGVIHCVSTRLGGVSSGSYSSLNLGFQTCLPGGQGSDDKKSVLANRQRLCAALGIKLDNLVLGSQVHKSNSAIVTRAEAGHGTLDRESALAETDALLTKETGLGLVTLSADCPLLLCYDPSKKVIATIHASWKGMIRGIIPKTINEMKQRFKSEPRDILVGIAPSIGPCCYEVKADFIKRMSEYHVLTKDFIQARKHKVYFDLWGMAYSELIRAGLKPEHIEVARICTSCHPDYFYSYRRDGSRAGRFGALIYQK